jgi:hypothetical protein
MRSGDNGPAASSPFDVSGQTDALLALLGPDLGQFVIDMVDKADESPVHWVRAAVASQVRRQVGLRRYSLRRRGLAQFTAVEPVPWIRHAGA